MDTNGNALDASGIRQEIQSIRNDMNVLDKVARHLCKAREALQAPLVTTAPMTAEDRAQWKEYLMQQPWAQKQG